MGGTATRSAGQAHEEHRLMAAFTRREPAALEELFARFSPTIYGIGLRCFGDGEAAADFAEHAFVTLWRRSPRYRSSSLPLETWVTCQALGVAIRRSRALAKDEPNDRRTPMMPNPLWLEQLLDDHRAREAAARGRSRRPRAKGRVSFRRAAAAVSRPVRDLMTRWRAPEPSLDPFETRTISRPEGIC
jgi:DNA-directed RNA polymerase specialized sigma24 family protein